MSKIMYQNVEYGESGVTSVNGSTGAVNIKTINGQGLVGSGNLTINTGLLNLVDGSATGSVRGIGTAEEDNSYTMGLNAFAEGIGTTASGNNSHAEGLGSQAQGNNSHAEGASWASGNTSHAEGTNTEARGLGSHSQNVCTIANKEAQTALGTFNDVDLSATTTHPSERDAYGAYAVIVGNGTDSNDRSNALTVAWNGDVVASGDVTDGSGNVLSDKIEASDVPTNETDPTVPSWAKASTKPSYTASEISGLMDFFYPVGSYYETSDTTFDPNTAWGGTWYLEVGGQVHVSSGTNYSVNTTNTDTVNQDGTVGVNQDGSKDAILVSHNHTFTGNALGNHDHTFTGNALGNHSHKPSNSDDFIYGNSLGTRSIKPGTGTAVTNNWYGSGTHGHVSSTNSVSAGTPSGTVGGKSAGTPSGSIDTRGENGTDKNMQPYIVVNRWHRTA